MPTKASKTNKLFAVHFCQDEDGIVKVSFDLDGCAEFSTYMDRDDLRSLARTIDNHLDKTADKIRMPPESLYNPEKMQ